MRAEEIRELTDEEIDAADRGARGGAFSAPDSAARRRRWKIRSACARLRKDIARLKTILRQRQLAATPTRAAR